MVNVPGSGPAALAEGIECRLAMLGLGHGPRQQGAEERTLMPCRGRRLQMVVLSCQPDEGMREGRAGALSIAQAATLAGNSF